MSLFHDAAELLADRSDTVSVSLRRGVDVTPNVPARIAETKTLREGLGGVMLEHITRDYKIKAADYIIDGDVTPPLEDDLILDSSSGSEVAYVVTPLDGEPCVRDADRRGVSYRIHTVERV